MGGQDQTHESSARPLPPSKPPKPHQNPPYGRGKGAGNNPEPNPKAHDHDLDITIAAFSFQVYCVWVLP